MTKSQFDLNELLEAIKAGGDIDVLEQVCIARGCVDRRGDRRTDGDAMTLEDTTR